MNNIYTNSLLIGPSIGSRWCLDTKNPFCQNAVKIIDKKNGYLKYQFVKLNDKDIDGLTTSDKIEYFMQNYVYEGSNKDLANKMGLDEHDYNTYMDDMERMYEESYKSEELPVMEPPI